MLAGERFSDHPRCACPALTAFLRGYNDAVNHHLRQDLFALASDLVGSRSPSEAVTTARGERLVDLAWEWERRIGPVRLSPNVGFTVRFDRYQGAGLHLGAVARRNPACHTAVLLTLRELIATQDLPAPGPSDERRRSPAAALHTPPRADRPTAPAGG